MIVERESYFNPACDVCHHMLPAVILPRNGDREAARAAAREKMAADGWTCVVTGEKRADVCAICIRAGRGQKAAEG